MTRLPLYLSLLLTLCWLPVSADGAVVTWGSDFTITAPTDISNPAGGSLIFAGDFNTTGDFGPGDDMINGILFQRVDEDIAGLLNTNIDSGPSYDTGYYPGNTGDPDLNALLDSHSYRVGNPTTATISLLNLIPGTGYQVQLITVADNRGCCDNRVYEPDDGQGNFTTGLQLRRGNYESVIGTFTADNATQNILLRSLNNASGNDDPGLSGIVLFEVSTIIPEPSTFLVWSLLAALGIGSAAYRRKR